MKLHRGSALQIHVEAPFGDDEIAVMGSWHLTDRLLIDASCGPYTEVQVWLASGHNPDSLAAPLRVPPAQPLVMREGR